MRDAKHRRWLSSAVVAILALGVAVWAVHDRLVLLANVPRIERHLRRHTPIGTSEGEVVKWLRNQHLEAEVHYVPFPAGDYPLSRRAGSAFIHQTIGYYYLPWRVDVEVFYSFNESRQLIDLAVRKTVDAL